VPIFLLGWTIFTLYMTFAATKTNNAVLTVFVLLSITFILLTIGNWGTTHTFTDIVKAGGWFGLATAAAAWYASAAGVTNATHGKVVFPWVHEANVEVTGGLPPDPTANSAVPPGTGAVGIYATVRTTLNFESRGETTDLNCHCI